MFDRLAILLVASFALGACGDGRLEQDRTFLNPSCAPDGSVVFYEKANKQGSYDGLKNSPANCTWNQKKS